MIFINRLVQINREILIYREFTGYINSFAK